MISILSWAGTGVLKGYETTLCGRAHSNSYHSALQCPFLPPACIHLIFAYPLPHSFLTLRREESECEPLLTQPQLISLIWPNVQIV